MAFSKEFQEKLLIGKYTKWAANLSEENLHALFLMVGEVGSRAFSLLPILEEQNKAKPYGGMVRVIEALKAIQDMYNGKRFNHEEAEQRIRDAVARFMKDREE